MLALLSCMSLEEALTLIEADEVTLEVTLARLKFLDEHEMA